MDITEHIIQMGKQARRAARVLAAAPTRAKDAALHAIADALADSRAALLEANEHDQQHAVANHLDTALLDRLILTDARIDTMIDNLHQVAALTDPIGEITDLAFRPSGIQVGRMRVPLGVIGMIYESRPNVTIEAASLCIKSGNAAILRGGSEAIHSNQAIARCINQGLAMTDLPSTAVQVIAMTDRAAVGALLAQPEVDVMIPRGGKALIERVSREAKMAVIKHLHGVCHVYIDDQADPEQALAIALNAKTQRYGTCNTMETLLVAADIAPTVLPPLAEALTRAGVELRGCQLTQSLVPDTIAATEEDWRTEYLAPILSIKVVVGLDAAIEHINHYGSQHTDTIVTEDYSRGRRFIREVDSGSVMINASTRFADGFEYGLGAEIGISTNKTHVRGPVGLEGLTIQKYVVLGDGHIRE